jgi:hypothetical protein
MSADNGYEVRKLYKSNPPRYGVFYYYASCEYNDDYYTEHHCIFTKLDALGRYCDRAIFDNPTAAIYAALSINDGDPTEYGVSVHKEVINDGLELIRQS